MVHHCGLDAVRGALLVRRPPDHHPPQGRGTEPARESAECRGGGVIGDAPPGERQCLAIAPLFFVADVARAAAYYRDVLGFTVERIWGEPPCFCMPHRDGLTIMLKEVADKPRI